MSAGIEARHARACPSRTGGRCNCSPTFQAHVWDAKAGKRIRKTFPNRSAAKRWRQDAYAQLRTGEMSAERGMKFEEAVEFMLDGMRAGRIQTRSGHPYKPAAIRGYRSSLYLRAVPRFRHLRLAEVTRRDVRGLVDAMINDEFMTATIDSDITPISRLFNLALDREEVRANPVHWRDAPAVRCRERRVVPYADAIAMLGALDAGAERTMWATAIFDGLRMGELSALGRPDIDLANNVITVHRNWDAVEGYVATKNRKPRKVGIPAVLHDYLDEYLLSTDRDEHIFGAPRWVSRAGTRAHERWREQGLPIIDLHEARHTYASLMIAAGTKQLALSRMMGHATTRITEDLYGHLFEGAEVEAATRFDAYAESQTVARTVAHPKETAV